MIVRLTILAALVSGIWAPPAAAQCEAPPIRIRNVAVWTRDGLVAARDVLFRNGRVATIEPTGKPPDDRIRTIDGSGHTLLPGLVDAHLHFSIPGGLPAPASGAPRTDAEAITGRQLLRSGVTAGRLHLTTLEEATRLEAASIDACAPLPRLQVGGPGLSGAAERDYPAFQGAKTADDARVKVGRARAAGTDWIAIHDAARAAGLRLMAAGSTPAEIAATLSAKPDTLDYFDRTADPYPAHILTAIRAQRNLVLVPTPGVPYRTTEYIRQPTLLEDPVNFEFLTDAERVYVLDNARKALTGADAERASRLRPLLPGKFRQRRETGLPMAIGSDAGSPLHFQAGAIWWELEAWRATGASHRDALIAATEHAARVLGTTDIGRLAVGSRADFVLYRGNVEEGAFALGRVLAVGKGGVLHVADGRWVGPPR
jgi:imidazolonepropionase-like amidohydrolase